MDRDTFAASDVPDDWLAVKRVTATRSIYHQVFNATHDNRIVARNQALYRAHARPQTRFLLFIKRLELLWPQILRDHIPRHNLAVTHRRQEVFRAAVPIFVGNPLEFAVAVAQKFFDREMETAGLFLEQLAANFDGFGALLIRHPVPYAIAGARGRHKIEPIARRMRVRTPDDFDYIAVLNHRTQRHHATVDPCPGAGVTHFRVDHVCEVNRCGTTRQLDYLAHGRKGIDIFRIKIEFECIDEFAGVLDLLRPFHQ